MSFEKESNIEFGSEGSDFDYHGCSSHYMIDQEEVNQHEKLVKQKASLESQLLIPLHH